METIFVTGGAGYIGSHTCVELLNAGYHVIVADNLYNSKKQALKRVQDITGKKPTFYQTDLRDFEGLLHIFSTHKIDAVIHFAGLKAVGESTAYPLFYYENNVSGTITLCKAMQEQNIKNIVFSSSATVYGEPETVPIKETAVLTATNPYGRTKLMIEQILRDIYHSDTEWNAAVLRYFNPVGAHPSGKIGEDPTGIPNNLMPYIAQVAIGRLDHLSVFGNDYPTRDGTGVRDYIHVVDLARGHLKALEKLNSNPGYEPYNLGTGKGYSVLEMVDAFEKACDRKIKYKFAPRRSGDISECFADSQKAQNELNWQAEYSIYDMCKDTWRWQQGNPNGYE
ncbi:MAG: UDP-glucose 4-epimerase GalE [candidate division KSB1 bacterium]|nr:UDP-glucose 4-epimerase GalE [candidate division KSB1 bacterium]